MYRAYIRHRVHSFTYDVSRRGKRGLKSYRAKNEERLTVAGRGEEPPYSDHASELRLRVGREKEAEEIRTVDGIRNRNTLLDTLLWNWSGS